GHQALVVDGREIDINPERLHETISGIYLSPDGTRWAYAGSNSRGFERRSFVATVAGRDRSYEAVGEPAMSWDGRQIAYHAVEGFRSFFVLNGHETAQVDSPSVPVFDVSGQHWAYIEGATSQRVVRDGQPGESYSKIDERSLCFSRDGRHL